MHREHPKGMTGYCLDVLRNETSQPNRYQINRTGYHGFAQASGCRYFNMMAELYDTLEALHQLHVDTVQQWLAAQVSPSACYLSGVIDLGGELPTTSMHGVLIYLSIVDRSVAHTSELQSRMRITYSVFCWKQ